MLCVKLVWRTAPLVGTVGANAGAKLRQIIQCSKLHSYPLFSCIRPRNFLPKRPALIPKTPRAYSQSALRLFPKRPALIAEAPRAYFRSALRLFGKSTALISEERGASGNVLSDLKSDSIEYKHLKCDKMNCGITNPYIQTCGFQIRTNSAFRIRARRFRYRSVGFEIRTNGGFGKKQIIIPIVLHVSEKKRVSLC